MGYCFLFPTQLLTPLYNNRKILKHSLLLHHIIAAEEGVEEKMRKKICSRQFLLERILCVM